MKFMLFSGRGQPRSPARFQSDWTVDVWVSGWCSGHKLQVESEAVIALLIHANAQLGKALKILIKVKSNELSFFF